MPPKPSSPLRVSTYISAAEVSLLEELLRDYQMQTISNVKAKLAETLLGKISKSRELGTSMIAEFAPAEPAP